MEKKHCPSCKENKIITDFNKCKSRYDGLQGECKICKRQRDLDYYYKNKTAYRKRSKEKRCEYKHRLDEHKEKQGCLYCGENDSCCLDFHHHSNDKETEVCVLLKNRSSWERIWAETQKCYVVCASCHRKIHAGRDLKPHGFVV